jgi:hypothetical protein
MPGGARAVPIDIVSGNILGGNGGANGGGTNPLGGRNGGSDPVNGCPFGGNFGGKGGSAGGREEPSVSSILVAKHL